MYPQTIRTIFAGSLIGSALYFFVFHVEPIPMQPEIVMVESCCPELPLIMWDDMCHLNFGNSMYRFEECAMVERDIGSTPEQAAKKCDRIITEAINDFKKCDLINVIKERKRIRPDGGIERPDETPI